MKWRDLMNIKETKFEVEECSILIGEHPSVYFAC